MANFVSGSSQQRAASDMIFAREVELGEVAERLRDGLAFGTLMDLAYAKRLLAEVRFWTILRPIAAPSTKYLSDYPGRALTPKAARAST